MACAAVAIDPLRCLELREDTMLKTISKTAIAATFALSASAGFAQVNLTSNAAGAGTAGALSATSLVENAAERGIANIQMKDGQTGTKYIMALAEGKIDLASGPFILPFLMAKAAGPYSNLEKDVAKELGHSIAMLYPYTFSIFTLYAYDSKRRRAVKLSFIRFYRNCFCRTLILYDFDFRCKPTFVKSL